MNRTLLSILNRASHIAPFLALGIVVALSILLPNRVQVDPTAVQRQADIRTAIDDVPHAVGHWHALPPDKTKAVPQEAQKLLRPNAILSRTYADLDGRLPELHVLLVHCSDARDMTGHYPPICYPSSGFTSVPIDPPDETLTIAGRPVRVRIYGFRHVDHHGAAQSVQIFNAFVLPDGTVTGNIDDIYKQSDRLAVSVQGVAQLQVILSANVPRTDAVDAVNEVLAGMSDLFHALGMNAQSTSGPIGESRNHGDDRGT